MIRSNRMFANMILASDISQRFRSAVEAAISFAIIMVLASLAARSFETDIVRTQISEAFSLTSTVRAELVTYRAQYGHWPAQESELHNPTLSQESGLGRFVDYLELQDGGALSVVFSDESSAAALRGRRLTFRPASVPADPGAPIAWLCSGHRVPNGLEPGGVDRTNIDPSHLSSACREY